MTNATKTLSIIFAGTLALALVTSWNWSDPSSAAFQGRLLSVDTSAVRVVQIDRSGGPSVRLKRGADGWRVASGDTTSGFPASRDAVHNLLESLPSLQVDAVVTRQSSKHPRYGVDSTGTTITMLGDGGEALGQLIVGRTRIRRPQSGGQGRSRRRRQGGTPITYVRTPEQAEVYSVERSLRSFASRSVEEWRDKVIWDVDRADIQRVDFTFPGDSSFTMRRPSVGDTASTVGPATWVAEGDTLARSKVSSTLRTLATLEADGFATGTSPSEVGPSQYEIRLHLSDGAKRTLRLRSAPEGSGYYGTTDEFEYVARFQQDTWDRILRGRTAYLDAN